MLYRTMPKNGDELSVLGFGCMRFPMLEGGNVDEDKAVEQDRDDSGRAIGTVGIEIPPLVAAG